MTAYKMSTLFQPKIVVPPGKSRMSDVTSRSQKLLIDLGLLRVTNTGCAVLLPVALRSLEKLKRVIRDHLNQVGGQEILLPALSSLHLLEKTNRSQIPELFKLKDRHNKELVLCPTHEEPIVNLVASVTPSYRQLPLVLYQMTSKFRDEIKPRFGLMRSREFLMKDMYCFSVNFKECQKLYRDVNSCYSNIFKELNLPFVSVEGCPGEIGGSLSHEFHVTCDIGEDKLIVCGDCGHGDNVTQTSNISSCRHCGSNTVTQKNGIEVGHSFLLGAKYSKPLNGFYRAKDNSLQVIEMSCHGIGISRLLAASIEALSTPENIRWPTSVAPFSVCIIPPKIGSNEEKTTVDTSQLIADVSQVFKDDVVVDDRTELTIGKRLREAKQMGYPFVMVIGKSSLETTPKIEIFDNALGTSKEVLLSDALNLLRKE